MSEVSIVLLVALTAVLGAYLPPAVTHSFEQMEQRKADEAWKTQIEQAKATDEYVKSLSE